MKKQKVEMIKKMKDEAKQAREKEKEARKEIIQMKKMMRQNETLAAQQGNKIQSQDELLKRRSMEIQTLKKKIKDDQMKTKKLSSTRKWFSFVLISTGSLELSFSSFLFSQKLNSTIEKG